MLWKGPGTMDLNKMFALHTANNLIWNMHCLQQHMLVWWLYWRLMVAFQITNNKWHKLFHVLFCSYPLIYGQHRQLRWGIRCLLESAFCAGVKMSLPSLCLKDFNMFIWLLTDRRGVTHFTSQPFLNQVNYFFLVTFFLQPNQSQVPAKVMQNGTQF